MRDKYADQDEEERQLRMEILAVCIQEFNKLLFNMWLIIAPDIFVYE